MSLPLKHEGCRTVIIKGRQYRGYVYVDEDALKTQSKLDYWVNLSLQYDRKPTKAPRKRGKTPQRLRITPETDA
jgi:TfoX/Sxy family transcriptional regulator of competence genes